MESLISLPNLRFTLENPRVSIAAPLYVMNTPFPENSLEPSAYKVNVARNSGREAKRDLSSKVCMGAVINRGQGSFLRRVRRNGNLSPDKRMRCLCSSISLFSASSTFVRGRRSVSDTRITRWKGPHQAKRSDSWAANSGLWFVVADEPIVWTAPWTPSPNGTVMTLQDDYLPQYVPPRHQSHSTVPGIFVDINNLIHQMDLCRHGSLP